MRKNKSGPRSEEMYRAMLKLRTEEECKMFLEDVCSISELMAMEQRYEVARRLYAGSIYNTIMAETGASSAIVSRVNRSLQYGAGGYEIVFERLDGEKKAE
jgi:TrpR-related protein YerC/YecD